MTKCFDCEKREGVICRGIFIKTWYCKECWKIRVNVERIISLLPIIVIIQMYYAIIGFIKKILFKKIMRY